MTANTAGLKLVAAPLWALLTFARVAAARMAKITTAMRHRRDMELLAGCDDRMLADIGLTRSDLRYALGEPFWRDPGAVLIARAGDRRAAWRRRRAASARPATVPSIRPRAADAAERFAPC